MVRSNHKFYYRAALKAARKNNPGVPLGTFYFHNLGGGRVRAGLMVPTGKTDAATSIVEWVDGRRCERF